MLFHNLFQNCKKCLYHEKIQNQTDHIGMALAALGNMVPKTNSTTPDVAGAEQAEAIAEVVESREATNQKLIALYEKMYDEVRKTDEERKADIAKNTFSELTLKIDKLDMRPQDKISAVLEITESIKEVLLQLMTE